MSETGAGRGRAAAAGRVVRRLWRPEVISFLAVGGAGYVVDVAVFNVLRSTSVLGGAADPSYARVLAVLAAMVVTYLGNRLLTWRGRGRQAPARRIALFVLVNVAGAGVSVACLMVSHDLLGLVTRLDDNVSANVVGTVLGTALRFWGYRRLVFTADPSPRPPRRATGELARAA